MVKDMKEIWVYAETRKGKVVPVFEELVSKARELTADRTACKVCGVMIGKDTAEEVKSYGIDKLYVIDGEDLSEYDADYYGQALAAAAKKYDPDVILFGATVQGSELAPTAACKLKTGLAAHCVNITVNPKDEMAFWVPAFGGNVIGEILVPSHRPQMASVKPGILGKTKYKKNTATEVITFGWKAESSRKTKPTEIRQKVFNGARLEDAELVIGAGRGITKQESWDNLTAVAEKLGAAVGYTRSFVDRGFVPDERDMIGTSGKSVTPKVYIGIGISGAAHHVAGMSKSGKIISINKDPKAKIFEISDYKVVADSNTVLTALAQKLSK